MNEGRGVPGQGDTWPRFVEASSILLFLLQALRALASGLFGIIYDQRDEPGAWLLGSAALATCALVVPAFLCQSTSRRWMLALVVFIAAARLGISINDADVRFFCSLAVAAGSVAYLAGIVRIERSLITPALFGALALDQLLRISGNTYDLSLRSSWLPVQAGWSALTIVLALRLSRRPQAEAPMGGLRVPEGLGLGGLLFLETSLLSLANAVARWSDGPYPVLAPLLLGISLLPLLPPIRGSLADWMQSRLVRFGMALALPSAIMLGYALSGVAAMAALLLAQGVALASLACILNDASARPRASGAGLALGLFLFLLLSVFGAFALTYPYTLPLMRGLGWAVYLVAALCAAGAVLSRDVQARGAAPPYLRPAWVAACGALALAISLISVWPRSASPPLDSATLRIATYNIHYGYDGSWRFTLEEMARAIEESRADVVALQEVDAGRMTSYGVDDAYYLARRLRMNVLYLPTVERVTGIALLYRGSADETNWRLLTSREEQTGIAHVSLTIDGAAMHFFGTWIGLTDEDTKRQIDEALQFIADRTPATFGGDFNVDPGSPVTEAIARAGFTDPFVALGVDPPPATAPAEEPRRRIDYVWLRGLTPVRAWVSGSLASDHRLVVVEVQRPR